MTKSRFYAGDSLDINDRFSLTVRSILPEGVLLILYIKGFEVFDILGKFFSENEAHDIFDSSINFTLKPQSGLGMSFSGNEKETAFAIKLILENAGVSFTGCVVEELNSDFIRSCMADTQIILPRSGEIVFDDKEKKRKVSINYWTYDEQWVKFYVN